MTTDDFITALVKFSDIMNSTCPLRPSSRMSDTSSTASSSWETAPTSRRSSNASFLSVDSYLSVQSSETSVEQEDDGLDEERDGEKDGKNAPGQADEEEEKAARLEAEKTFDRSMGSITALSLQMGCPVPLSIVRAAARSRVERFLDHLNDINLGPREKESVHGIANLGLYLVDAGDSGMDEYMKREVRSFVGKMHGSRAQMEFTHLDVGWAPTLHHLPTPQTAAEDNLALGEQRLQDQMALLDASSLDTNERNRALLLRTTRWISLALPNIHTLTLHLHKDHLLCLADSEVILNPAKAGYIDALIEPFPNLEEVNLVCAEPFVAPSWIVSEGRVFSSADRMSEVVERLRGREYYRNGGRRLI